jgi:hypothetical protein
MNSSKKFVRTLYTRFQTEKFTRLINDNFRILAREFGYSVAARARITEMSATRSAGDIVFTLQKGEDTRAVTLTFRDSRLSHDMSYSTTNAAGGRTILHAKAFSGTLFCALKDSQQRGLYGEIARSIVVRLLPAEGIKGQTLDESGFRLNAKGESISPLSPRL